MMTTSLIGSAPQALLMIEEYEGDDGLPYAYLIRGGLGAVYGYALVTEGGYWQLLSFAE